MKILKYIVIILVLSVVFLSVYIATGKSDFEFNVSKQTELSNQRIYRYVDNLENFPEWNPWNNNESAFKLDSIHKGTGAQTSWIGDKAFIEKSLANDTIYLKLHVEGNDYDTKMYFSDANLKTNIHWNVKGNLSFTEKVQLFFKGTPETMIAPIFDKGLSAIHHHITENLKNFTIKSENLTVFNETFYIKQTVESRIENLGDKIFQSIEHMNNFAKNYELEPYGSPFSIFENINLLSGSVKYSVCLPIKNFFSTAEGSDIVCEKMPMFHGYKIVLTGDYIHSNQAWEEAKKQVQEKKLTQRADVKPIAIYKNSILTTQKSNEWITEFLIPVNESYIPIVEEQVVNDSLTSL
ncbi:MAG TPA: hypothetical protein VLY87_03645 [Flavobacterium sp.]|nr:hypothetical protein [Flavobacterium sp.]